MTAISRLSHVLAIGALACISFAFGCASTPSATTKGDAPAPKASSVVRINDDVSCDKSAKRCDFRGQPSVGVTRAIFGDSVASTLQSTSGLPIWKSDPIFEPAIGQSCDTLSAACYDREGPNVALTRATFGGNAATRLNQRMTRPAKGREIVKYGSSVTCDRGAGICYDGLGASVGYTRLYLGETQSDQLLTRMRPHRN
jgi:hypothetical protein